MKEYQRCTSYVLNYLTENHYCQSLIHANERCFRKLGEYLEQRGIDYSPGEADKWFSMYPGQTSASDRNHARIALIRLRDVYYDGQINAAHDTRHLMSYTMLNESMKQMLAAFLSSMEGKKSLETIDGLKHTCARFLIFLQRNGVEEAQDISYELIVRFYQEDIHKSSIAKGQSNAAVSALMAYLFQEKRVPFGFTIIIHYLSTGKNSGCYWNDVSPETHVRIADIIASAETAETDTLRTYKEETEKLYVANGYSKTMITGYRRAADLLILFLEMNGYRYNPEVSVLWFTDIRHYFGEQAATIRRGLLLIADYYRTSQVRLEKIYRSKPSDFYLLPEWCRLPAEEYVDSKIKEGWERSTLDMIRSSITRFCVYLDRIGIRSFTDINASHIKQFNASDNHKTPQGKNAYNGRIRKFLIYLGSHGYLSNPMLFVSLSRTSAPKETIVVILTEEEMMELNNQLGDDESGLSLRKKAMLLLGLKMGLRSIDVVNLKLDDVNWTTASIRFVQKKTAVEVNLPMPAEVGNALFRYITEERGLKSTKNIFLSENAPRKPVGRAVCGRALKTALPDRDVPGSGFHVTRKTYATNLLRSGVGTGMVAEALGQQGTASVCRYLSLDTDRMRMCGISLAEYGVGGLHYGK